MNASPFLATTALEEFWDGTVPIVLISEWCRIYGKDPGSAAHKAAVLASPWQLQKAIDDGYSHVDEVYEWLLPLLGKRLNEVHRTSFGDRYWRIVAGPWLVYFLHSVYDRYMRIKAAIAAYPDFTTLGLAEDSFLIPVDLSDFADKIKGDRYNLQIFTRILKEVGRLPALKPAPQPRNPPAKRANRKNSLGRTIAIALIRRAVQPFAAVFLRDAYFSTFRLELTLIAKSMGRAAAIYAPMADISGVAPDPSMRLRLKGLSQGAETDEFRKVAASLVSSEIPLSLLEGWKKIGDFRDRYYRGKPKAVFSTNAYHFDEAFKQFAGGAADRGAEICGAQHGGNYGCFLNMPFQEFEIKQADRYYSWGWSSAEFGKKIRPFPATKLMGRPRIPADNSRTGILFVTTTTPRYPFAFQFSEHQHLGYIDSQLRFFRSAILRFGSALRVRPHIEDSGWEYVKRWRAEFPNLEVETWVVPFMESLRDCRIYVSDHLETTFVEALAAGKPSILFLDPAQHSLREEAKPFYKSLETSGILHMSPESAAAALQEAYDDVETWWNLPSRVEARVDFCRFFALTAENGVDLWAAEFRSLAESKGG